MGGEWIECALVDACSSIDYGLTASATDSNVGPKFLRITDIVPGHIDWNNVPYVAADAKTIEKYRLSTGDVVVARTGASTGVSAYVKNPPLAVFASYLVRLKVKPEFDPRFVAYYLKSEYFRTFIRGVLGDKSAQPNASAATMAKAPFRAPKNKGEQRRIAHILGTLDDKIELNRKMNQTLEAIARAIFKSWFVDFDPVIDNALAAGKPIPEEFAERAARRAQLTHGKSPLPENIRRLFPDEFQDSELGPIPKGWEVGPLGRFFEVGLGGAWGKDAGTSKDVVVRCLRGIDCHELAEGRLPEAPVRWLTPKQVDARRLADGVILVEGSGSFCGRSFLWRTEYERLFGEPVVYSNFCKRLNPTCTLWQATVCWQFMRKAYREGEIQSFRTGTAFPNLDIHNLLGNLIVCVPPEPVARTYGQFFELTSRPDLIERSRTLAALRDTLLPKLMSGELRVKDAEWLTLTTSTLKKKV